jgi:hypothetical protein
VEQKALRVQDIREFIEGLFDREEEVEKGAPILKAILDGQSPRVSDIAQHLPGKAISNYKAVERYLELADPAKALLRTYMEDAPYVLADPTEIARPQAKKTEYVGILKDGKTRGFQTLVFGTPYRGRAIPFHFITYSSATIGDEATSRNLEHRRALRMLREILGKKPVVMDREFSYESLLGDFAEEKLSYVIRLNTGSKVTITDDEGQKLLLSIAPGEKVIQRGVFYRDKVKLNLAGEWKKGFSEPLWVISNLPPEHALEVYKARMKLEESFKDLKSLLKLDKLMNKRRENLEKMIALVLLAYTIGFLVGEALRDRMYPVGGKKKGLSTPASSSCSSSS